MSGRRIALFLAVPGAAALAAAMILARRSEKPAPAPAATGPVLTAVGPRVISNQSDYPVMIWGERFTAGATLILGDAKKTRVPTSFVDERHLTAIIPAGLEVLPQLATVDLGATLEDREGRAAEGTARIVVANDTAFPTPYAMAAITAGSGREPSLAIASPSTDELHLAGAGSLRTGDGPRALATYRDEAGDEWLAIAHQRGELRLVRSASIAASAAGSTLGGRVLRVAPDLQDLAIDRERRLAYLTSHEGDRVMIVDLTRGEVKGSLAAGVNPRAIALAEGGTLAVVANIASEDVSIIHISSGEERRIRPGPGTPIIGGNTERFTADIMGGKAGRGLVYSEKLHVAFMSTIGPNIGPNKERMEVTMNGGVSVIDAKNAKYLRHVSMLGGVAEGLALDDTRGLVYAADGSTGRVVVFDAKKLAAGDDEARKALLGALLLPRPEEIQPFRPREDFGVNGRATESLHFGPKALALSSGGDTLFVMGRFSGTVAELDVSRAAQGKLAVRKIIPGWVGDNQPLRRRGEIIYFTDLGNSRMTCDTCHPEGHAGGLLFSKGRPIRIYRGLTLRGIRESPPYFTPSRLPSIRRTGKNVLARNRFFNPKPTKEELDALTEYVGAISVLPNPHLAQGGELPRELMLPDGKIGDARAGLAIFEGKGGCAAATCHPPPSFTGDQTPATRGTLHQLGTPVALMIRPELQDLETNFGQPPPSLLGVWDTFPLFLSGAGGNELAEDQTIVAKHPFALRWILENPKWAGHANGPAMSETERNDLLAYLLTL